MIARETVTTQEFTITQELKKQNLTQFEWWVQDFSFHAAFIPVALSISLYFLLQVASLSLIQLHTIMFLGFYRETAIKTSKINLDISH